MGGFRIFISKVATDVDPGKRKSRRTKAKDVRLFKVRPISSPSLCRNLVATTSGSEGGGGGRKYEGGAIIVSENEPGALDMQPALLPAICVGDQQREPMHFPPRWTKDREGK